MSRMGRLLEGAFLYDSRVKVSDPSLATELLLMLGLRILTRSRRHLRSHHQQAPTISFCLRCHMQFSRLDDLQTHSRLPPDQMCTPRHEDAPRPEEMSMNNAMRVRLQSRARADQFDWSALWRALFPSDVHIPKPGWFQIYSSG